MNICPYFLAPLHQRINEDMLLRKLATKTQIAYISGVNKLCEYLKHSLENTTCLF
jgi:integrase/recombinase XerD